MARATLIHNTTAGDGHPTGGELRELIARHGFELAYATTDEDLDKLLQDPGDLVIAAGGDGTVGQVAARLIGRDVPLAILPVGTANNLATTLGMGRAVDLLVAGWATASCHPLNVGVARGPWGEQPFVESFGLGFFAHIIPVLSALKKQGDEPMLRERQIREDRRGLRQLLSTFGPRPADLRLDGEPAPGEYLLVEVMNAPMLGPRLHLAPGADPGDGVMDVVLAKEEDRQRISDWLHSDPEQDPGLQVRSTRRVEFTWHGDPVHIDGDTWSDSSASFRSGGVLAHGEGAPVVVTLEPHSVAILVPSR